MTLRSRPLSFLVLVSVLLLGAASLAARTNGTGGALPVESDARAPNIVSSPGSPTHAVDPLALASASSSWIYLPSLGAALRGYDNGTVDSAIEVVLAPGYSGSADAWESFLFQYPSNPGRPGGGALVIGFHSFSVSEKNIFGGTTLPQECTDRGWYLLAPLGLVGENYANVQSQDALDAVLATIKLFFDFDEDRIYTVGFSMGGANALSWAMRHQDPAGLRAAGVVAHTAVIDLIKSYEIASSEIQSIMSNPLVFGGDPAAEPFAYERASPFTVEHGLPNPDVNSVSNLLNIPIYLHYNLQDNQFVQLAQNQLFRDYLQIKGGVYHVSEVDVSAAPVHSWATMDMTLALNYVSAAGLSALPDHADLFADRPAAYLHCEVLDLLPETLARWVVDIDVSGNAVGITNTKNLGALALELSMMGLDPSLTLMLQHSTLDATDDVLVLRDWPLAPASVLVGGVPSSAWSHDALAAELTLMPATGGVPTLIQIEP